MACFASKTISPWPLYLAYYLITLSRFNFINNAAKIFIKLPISKPILLCVSCRQFGISDMVHRSDMKLPYRYFTHSISPMRLRFLRHVSLCARSWETVAPLWGYIFFRLLLQLRLKRSCFRSPFLFCFGHHKTM